MEIQKFKQIIYLPVKVEDEFPDGECVMISKTHDMLVGYPADVNGEIQADDAHQILRYITHWLKEQEGYFFTPEQLNEYTANVIKQALESAAENAKVVEEELGSDEYRENPIDTFESVEFTADKGYEECSFYRYKCSKQSITNTFEQTFKQFEV